MKKRLTTLLMILVCCLFCTTILAAGSISASAATYSGTCGADGDNLTWSLDDSTGEGELSYSLSADNTYYIVSGIGTYTGKNVVIEEEYNGLPVRAIERYAFENCKQMETLYVPSSVQIIGAKAFANCVNLTHAEVYGRVSDSSTTYESDANCAGYGIFYGCSNLKKLVLSELEIRANLYGYHSFFPIGFLFGGDYVNGFGGDGQYGGSVTNTMYPLEGQKWEFVERDYYLPASLTTLYLSGYGLKSYTGSGYVDVFYGCSSIHEVVIDFEVSYIPDSLFSGFEGLEEITVPSSVKSIEQDAFYRCLNLKVINYAGTVEEWNAITFESDWDKYTDNYTVKCTDGEFTKDGKLWGYDGNDHTYSFVTNCDMEFPSVTSAEKVKLPTPERSGYGFVGWYSNADFSGDAVYDYI